jgi:hypothetical protein
MSSTNSRSAEMRMTNANGMTLATGMNGDIPCVPRRAHVHVGSVSERERERKRETDKQPRALRLVTRRKEQRNARG